MNSIYSTIFFDLDHTLWDYETNSKETLSELYHSHDLMNMGVQTLDDFLVQFRLVNQQLWHLYDHGKITSDVIRKERFKQILVKFKIIDERLTQQISHEYLETCPRKGSLMPNTLETLDYLRSHYSLTVITNGFEDIQRIKLESGNITSYFDHIITSQKAGHKKPAREIFHYALQANSIEPQDAIMIGDNLLTDIAGAKNASIDVIFFNPDGVEHQEKVNHEIQNLNELCKLL